MCLEELETGELQRPDSEEEGHLSRDWRAVEIARRLERLRPVSYCTRRSRAKFVDLPTPLNTASHLQRRQQCIASNPLLGH